ncbi:hypothetical protein [Robinsoniella peoriensis]|uniref:hypothetical protein n=1 Tax=Robinsoniella peoriensis TaxID=180332 RepID=UPI0005C7C2FF|nr:hypothetical protein [Robinsoniella peoriensis]
MSNALLKLADSLTEAAESLRVLADEKISGNSDHGIRPQEQASEQTGKKENAATSKKEKPVAVEDIRAVLAEKSQDGKSRQIKELLGKYGVAKLSAVEEKDYPALLQEAKVL